MSIEYKIPCEKFCNKTHNRCVKENATANAKLGPVYVNKLAYVNTCRL